MDEQQRRFMLHFPPEHRGAIANAFYRAVRAGHQYPKAICSAAYRDAWESEQSRKKWRSESDHGVRWNEVLRWMEEDQQGALDFALDVYMRESRSPEERKADKEEQERQGRLEYMRGQPATEKQIAVLRKLGYTDEILDKAHASELIEELKTW